MIMNASENLVTQKAAKHDIDVRTCGLEDEERVPRRKDEGRKSMPDET